MAAGDIRVADPLDTVNHKMDSVVPSHCVYISVWSPVIEQLVLEKKPAGQSTQCICNGSDKGFSDVWATFCPKNYSQIMWYMRGLCLLSHY